MNTALRFFACACFLTALFCGLTPLLAVEPPTSQLPPDPGPLSEPEVLEQGPIHEAFAEPLSLDAQSPQVVLKEPPQPIEEFPPEVKPEGENVQWVGGYFQWDPEREDFVWVSGFYRDLPPERAWVPGEWQQAEEGWQWFPGYWIDGDAQQSNFLPEPPVSIEQGPSSPAPGDSFLWAPGCWRWHGNAYAWQAGYWYEARPDWVWVPSHYSCRPYGHVYVGGYWDYPLVRRGLLYAPVYWGSRYAAYSRHNRYWRPYHAINTGLLIANLFVDRHHSHYWFGYGNRRPNWAHPWGHPYARHGQVGRSRYHDPLWAHHSWQQRGKGTHPRTAVDRGRHGNDLVVKANDLQRRGDHAMKLRKLSTNELAAQRRLADNRKRVVQQDQTRRRMEMKGDGQKQRVAGVARTGKVEPSRSRTGEVGRIKRQAEGPSLAQPRAKRVAETAVPANKKRAKGRTAVDESSGEVRRGALAESSERRQTPRESVRRESLRRSVETRAATKQATTQPEATSTQRRKLATSPGKSAAGGRSEATQGRPSERTTSQLRSRSAQPQKQIQQRSQPIVRAQTSPRQTARRTTTPSSSQIRSYTKQSQARVQSRSRSSRSSSVNSGGGSRSRSVRSAGGGSSSSRSRSGGGGGGSRGGGGKRGKR